MFLCTNMIFEKNLERNNDCKLNEDYYTNELLLEIKVKRNNNI